MQGRLEYKYLLPKEKLAQFRSRIRPYLTYDPYTEMRPEKEYTVRSIYYDTRQFDYYQEKNAGLKIRKKLRIRGYNEPEEECLVYLEIKRKNEQFISKDRAGIRYADLADFLDAGDVDRYVRNRSSRRDEKTEAGHFYYHLRKSVLSPSLLVIYEREAFFGRFNDTLRITLDKNLRSEPVPGIDRLFCDDRSIYALPDHVIVELKCNGGFPGWFAMLVQEFRIAKAAVSKYCIGLDSHKRQAISERFPGIHLFKDLARRPFPIKQD